MAGQDILTAVAFALISQLGAPSFQAREAAQIVLQTPLPFSWPHLASAAKKNSDPEIAVRCRQILRLQNTLAMRRLLPRLRPSNYSKFPWINLLPGENFPFYGTDWNAMQNDFLEVARNLGLNDCSPEWETWRKATELMVEFLAQHGWEERRIISLLDRMVAAEKSWQDANKRPPAP
jgi:hypothetical protein